MPKTGNSPQEIEPGRRVGDFPADMTDPANPPLDALTAAANRLAKRMDDSLLVETQDEGAEGALIENGLPRVTVMGTTINPSSTFPGRNQELV
jgi:hypothetical protein